MITQISYEYREGMFQGTNEFRQSLKNTYNVHERPKWMPAAGGNFEMWFDIFFDVNLIDFLRDAVIVGGINMAKNTVFKPFLDSLGKLEKANEYPLEIQKYSFYFEDTKVVVYGLSTNFTSIFSAVFSELFDQYDIISNSIESDNIHEIRIPVDPTSGRNEWWVGPEEISPYLTYWGISLDYGVEYVIWNVKEKKIYENS